MSETLIGGLTAAQVSLLLSVVAAYGLMLIYVYQAGFFGAIGYEFAGLTSPLELWSNAGRLAAYLAAVTALAIAIAFIFQAAKQLEIGLAGWLVANETAVFIGIFVITLIPAAATYFGRRSNFDQYAMVANLATLLVFIYAHYLTDAKYSVWQVIFAVVYPPMLSASLGFNQGFFARNINVRRYNVYFDADRYLRVRLLRASSSGILFAPDEGGPAGFITASKIEVIVQVDS